MSLWLPDKVTSALEGYLETLTPLSSYAAWVDAAWRRCNMPFHLSAEPASSAPLSFSLKDDPISIESQDSEAIRYRAQLLVTWLYPLYPADVDACWRRALLSGHHLLAHLLRPTAAMPRGILPITTPGTQIRRSPTARGYLVCDLSTPVLYDSPLTWS